MTVEMRAAAPDQGEETELPQPVHGSVVYPLVAAGANHLLVNPVGRYTEQVEALAEVVGLS
jgi:hypothetical protein